MARIPESRLREAAQLACSTPEGYMEFVFGHEPTWFHREWLEFLQDDSNTNLLFICPPDSAKTTVLGIVYTSFLICHNPDIHIGYVSDTFTQAAKQSVAARDMIQYDPQLHLAFPDKKLDHAKGSSEAEWFVRRPNLGDKDATFIATGVGGPLLGARLDLLIFDDIVDKENSATELQRDKVYDWLTSTAFSRVVSGGRKIGIGTRWHEDDVYGRLEELGFKKIIYKAIDSDYRNYR